MKVSSITLIFENCEEVTFQYPSEIFMLDTGYVKEYYISYSNGLHKQKYIDGFSIVFQKDSGQCGVFSSDNTKTPLERLNQYKDVTGIAIEYENNTQEYLGVSWEDIDSEVHHSGQGLVLTEEGNVLYYSETGGYECNLKQDLEEIDIWAEMVKP